MFQVATVTRRGGGQIGVSGWRQIRRREPSLPFADHTSPRMLRSKAIQLAMGRLRDCSGRAQNSAVKGKERHRLTRHGAAHSRPQCRLR